MLVPLKHLDTEGGVLCTGIYRWKCDATLVLPHPRRLPSEITCPDCIGLFKVGEEAYEEAVQAHSMAPNVARLVAVREARAKILSTARWAPERATVSCEGPTMRTTGETFLRADTEVRLRHMDEIQGLHEKAHLRLFAAHMRRAFARRGLSVTVNDTGSSVTFHTVPKRDMATLFVIAQGEAGAFTRVDLGMPVEPTRCTHAALHRGSCAALCGAVALHAVATTAEPHHVTCPLCLHRLGPKFQRLTQLVADLLGYPLQEVRLLPNTDRAWIEVRLRGLPPTDEEAAVICPVLNAYCDAAARGNDHDPTCTAIPYVDWKVAPVVSGGPVLVRCKCRFELGELAEETKTRSPFEGLDPDSIVPGGAQGGVVGKRRRALAEVREAGEDYAKAEPDSHDAWLANPYKLGSPLWAAWRDGLWGELPPAHRLRVLGGCLQETGRAAFDRGLRTTPLTAGHLDAITTPLRALLAELDAERASIAPES